MIVWKPLPSQIPLLGDRITPLRVPINIHFVYYAATETCTATACGVLCPKETL